LPHIIGRLFFFIELTTLRANTLIMKTLEEEVAGLNTKKDELNEHIIALETGRYLTLKKGQLKVMTKFFTRIDIVLPINHLDNFFVQTIFYLPGAKSPKKQSVGVYF